MIDAMKWLLLAFMLLPAVHRAQDAEGMRDPATCAPEGRGGDALLNRLKNREAVPLSSPPMTWGDLSQLPSQPFAAKLPRVRWPGWWQKQVAAVEARAVTLEGFVMAARHEGKEAANCYDETLHDVHLMLAANLDDPRGQWLVAELTPRLRVNHPAWHMKRLRRLARDHRRVRLTGWLLYDQEHLAAAGQSRLSPWEIHPVTRIEIIREDGKWIEW